MKLISKLFVLAFIASLFASCGGDNPVDYTLKDLNAIAGTFTGQCVITPSGTGSGTNAQTVNTTVRLVRNSTTNTMQLETDESGAATNHGDVLSNFKTTSDGTAYTFDIKGFNFTRTNLSYINAWFPSPTWSNISDVAVTVNASNDARYNLASKTLTFSYTATAKFMATPQIGAASQQTVNLKYSYTVVRQ